MSVITAPIPGVFYRQSDPDEDPYIKEGDEVEEGQVIGLVGVMKNFHEITAESAGTIERILVENEEEIKAGQDLVEITDS